MHGRSLLIVSSVLALAACEVNVNSEGVVARDVKTFTVSGVPDVHVETFDGAIDVHSWDRNEVEVEIEKRAIDQGLVDEMRVTAEQEGDRIVVKVSGPSSYERRGITIGLDIGPSARLRIALPRNANLEARSADGAITVEDISGTVKLNTGDGSVRLSRVSGEMVVRSGDGTIRLDDVSGKLDLETDDGSISGEAAPTGLRAHTGDGSIRLELGENSKMDDDWDIQTSDGSIILTLPADFAAELDAESRDGIVRASHPGIAKETGEGAGDERRRSMRATLGSGGKVLRVRTGDGSIRIEN
jgi:hypothetical protein